MRPHHQRPGPNRAKKLDRASESHELRHDHRRLHTIISSKMVCEGGLRPILCLTSV